MCAKWPIFPQTNPRGDRLQIVKQLVHVHLRGCEQLIELEMELAHLLTNNNNLFLTNNKELLRISEQGLWSTADMDIDEV